MIRQELLYKLAQLIYLVPNAQMTIGVILPSFAEVKRFHSDLNVLLDEMPGWVNPKAVVRNTKRVIEFGQTGSIVLLHSVHDGRGRSFNSMFLSSRLLEDQKTQFMFNIMPTMLHGTIETFEDKHEEVQV